MNSVCDTPRTRPNDFSDSRIQLASAIAFSSSGASVRVTKIPASCATTSGGVSYWLAHENCIFEVEDNRVDVKDVPGNELLEHVACAIIGERIERTP